jgi:hypothetical protein
MQVAQHFAWHGVVSQLGLQHGHSSDDGLYKLLQSLCSQHTTYELSAATQHPPAASPHYHIH